MTMNRWPLFLITLTAGLLWAFFRTQEPTPLPADAPAGQFSAMRAMADVRVLAKAPHPTGSAASAAVIAHLETRLASLGFSTRRLVTPLDARSAALLAKRGGDPRQPAISLVAVRAGRDPAAPAVALMAHHDSVWASPGAADDIAGVAAALEIARAIPQAEQQRDLVLLFTDAEELGLVGAHAVFDRPGDPIAHRLGVVINLEARGGGGRAMMFQTGPNNGDLVRLLASASPDAIASSIAVTVYENLPNDTDFTPVLTRGITGLNFAFLGEAWAYHSPLATPDRLVPGAVQHLGDSVLGVTRAMLTASALPAATPSAVFAAAPGLGLLVLPPSAGWGVLAVSFGLIALAAWWRRADWTGAGVALGSGQALLTAIVAGLLMFGLNLLSGSVGGEYYDRLAALPRLEAVAGLAAVAALLFVSLKTVGSLWDRGLGFVLLCLATSLAVQVWLPNAGPIFAWPGLLAALGIALAARPGATGAAQLAPAALLAVPGLTLTGELAHFIMLGVGAPMPWATALLFVPVLALLAPLLPEGPRRPAFGVGLVAVTLAAGIALWVALDAPAASVPPYAGTEKQQG